MTTTPQTLNDVSRNSLLGYEFRNGLLGYEFHPACLLMPRMQQDEYEALRKSISNGFDGRHQILLFDGKILDGRHRYNACIAENVEPQFAQWSGGNPYEFVRKEHEARRSWLSQVQKSLVLLKLLEASEDWQATERCAQDAANLKRAEAANNRPRNDNGTLAAQPVKPQVVARLAETPIYSDPANKTATARATAIGVNRGAVEQAETIRRHSPELAEQVVSGEIPASKAIQTIQREKTRSELKKIAEREIEQPTGLYDVIVIDPPWPMKKIERDVTPNQVDFNYPTMSEEELALLTIPAEEHCHAWIWTTNKFLPMAFRLIDGWGLKYVCTFVWHKSGGFQPFGLPQYNCEFALYARKGNPVFLDTKSFPLCFHAPRGAHSEKPDEFYDVVRRVTEGRRIDMFNRRRIEGFSVWGNEAGGSAP